MQHEGLVLHPTFLSHISFGLPKDLLPSDLYIHTGWVMVLVAFFVHILVIYIYTCLPYRSYYRYALTLNSASPCGQALCTFSLLQKSYYPAFLVLSTPRSHTTKKQIALCIRLPLHLISKCYLNSYIGASRAYDHSRCHYQLSNLLILLPFIANLIRPVWSKKDITLVFGIEIQILYSPHNCWSLEIKLCRSSSPIRKLSEKLGALIPD